jgi:hypothetical protein
LVSIIWQQVFWLVAWAGNGCRWQGLKIAALLYRSALSNPFATRHMWRMAYKTKLIWRYLHLIQTLNHQRREMAQDVKAVKNFNTWGSGDAVLTISQKCDEWPFLFATTVANAKIMLGIADIEVCVIWVIFITHLKFLIKDLSLNDKSV